MANFAKKSNNRKEVLCFMFYTQDINNHHFHCFDGDNAETSMLVSLDIDCKK